MAISGLTELTISGAPTISIPFLCSYCTTKHLLFNYSFSTVEGIDLWQ